MTNLFLILVMLTLPLFPRPGRLPQRAIAADPRAPSYTVSNTTDATGDCLETPTDCSLRQAINAANANAGSDVIAFNIPTSDPGYDSFGGGWTITLTQSLVLAENSIRPAGQL
jgi:CSLREA domain-containing protein